QKKTSVTRSSSPANRAEGIFPLHEDDLKEF
ncbi:MAG: hypothetical protein QG617_1172, partial [Campylobacterota bacterium]|nr:hypothetical protein [Campylobacterota bacterium]